MDINYGIEDIKALSTLEGFRLRPQMYLGSADLEGAYQAFKEIVNNSTDESQNGYGNKIIIDFEPKTNMIRVRDYGRGVPFGIRESGENVLIQIYTELHVGGKFNHKAYKNAGGLNGCGGSATCATSSYFKVTSFKEGKTATAEFKEGINISYKEGDTKEPNGTIVEFIPDSKVFNIGDINYSFEEICKRMENTSYFNKGVHFIVNNLETKEKKEYYSKNGILDFVNAKATQPLMKPITYSVKDETDELEIVFLWTGGREASYVFVNGLLCPEGGSPITGAKTALTTKMKQIAGANLDGELIRKGLVYAINCKVSDPSFANQTKTKINNPNLRTLASEAFRNGLDIFKSSPDCDSIVLMLTKYQKAEAAAEKARKQILETSKEIEKNAGKKVFNSDKLKDAEFLGPDSTLLIVEGNSAAGSMANARDYTKYGILAIRGKILNALANSDERIADNEEITLLLKALNIVPGKYNPAKLRYGRVAICSDADSDGYHIGLLIMSVLRYLAPQFLNEGRLCWLRSPLYIVSNNKKESYYYDDDEFNAVRGEVKGEVTRCKGLGTLSADQAHNSMFTSEFQRMDKLEPTEEALVLLEQLMGESSFYRTKFVFENIDFTTIHE